MNDDYLGRPARYGYHQRVARAPTLYFDGVIKYDFDGGRSLFHGYGEGCVGAETVFVPRPNPRGEDDGFVMTFVTDARTGGSELVIIDALEFDAPPVARVKMPRRVPFGFHAHWVPGAGIPRP